VFLETDDLDPVKRGDDGDDTAGEKAHAADTVDVTVRTPVSVRPSPGETLTLTIDSGNVYLFDAGSGDAIRTSPSAGVRPTQ
jgi:hypothetical protein